MSGTTSVGQVFTQRGLVQWWTMRPTKVFGGKQNGEWGQDYGLPLNTPVGSLTSGRVIYAGPMQSNPGSSVGYIVQVEQSDGSVIHYQHLRTSHVQVGQYVHVGDVVGLSGGCPASGYGPNGCTHTDQYTTGPHIEVRYAPSYNSGNGIWSQGWQAPQTALNFFSGAPVTNAGGMLDAAATGAVLGSGGCNHSLTIFPGATVCMDAGEDLFIRSGFVLGGAVLIVFALIVFVWNVAQPTANVAAEGFIGSATGAAGGVLGSRSAEKALDKTPIRRPRQAAVPKAPASGGGGFRFAATQPKAPAAAPKRPAMPVAPSADLAQSEAEQAGAQRWMRQKGTMLDELLNSIREPNAGHSAIDKLRMEGGAAGEPEGQRRKMGAGGDNRRKRERERRAERKNRPPNVTDLRAPRRGRRGRKRGNSTDLPPAAAAGQG